MDALLHEGIARLSAMPAGGTRPPHSPALLEPVEAERLAKEAYSLIGPEYYESFHLTTRNFDASISTFLREHPIKLVDGFRYLEVGCGRSRLNQFQRAGSQLVLLDISFRMLSHSLSEGVGKSAPLIGSAFTLPFRSGAFNSVYSFLSDPFLHPAYLAELQRVLVPKGETMLIIPSAEWGATLRESRGEPLHFSHFFRGHQEAYGPSFLASKSELRHLLRGAGFRYIEITDMFLPASCAFDKISPDITVPAKLRGLTVYELPILNAIHAIAE